jgi:inner membrane transporter RhtA
MARATFALLLALLPATAAVIGVVVLRQTPTVIEVVSILLVMSGVAIHKEGTYE